MKYCRTFYWISPLVLLLLLYAGAAWGQALPRVSGPGDMNWDDRFGPPPGLGLNGPVEDIAQLPNGDLIVVGNFQDAGGDPNADGVARWDGTSWHALGAGLGSTIAVVLAPNGDVLVGGYLSGVLRWDGSTWQPFGTGLNGAVFTLALLPNGDVVAGGEFSNAGGNPDADRIARWDGTTWHALGAGIGRMSSAVYAIAVAANGDLVVGGGFVNAGGNPAADYITRWDGAAWQPLGPGFTAPVYAVRVLSNGSVLAGGYFTDAGGNPAADYIARWDGTAWQAVGTGAAGYVVALAQAANGDIVAGGFFVDAGGNPNADRVARWDGTNWQALGTGVNAGAYGVTVASNGDILVGGSFTAVGDGSKLMSNFGIYHSTPTGLLDAFTSSLTLAPNPAHHSVRLTDSPAPTATLLDAVGRTVRTWVIPASGELDLTGLAPGLYSVRAGARARRLVVE